MAPAAAQDISVNFGQGNGLTERVIQMIALLTVLSLAPSILVMMTSFTRIVVVLSLLRTALGTATAPPNAVIVSLALFLTAFVMGPAFTTSWRHGIRRSWPMKSPPSRPSNAAHSRCARSCKRTCARRTSNSSPIWPRKPNRPSLKTFRCACWCRPS
jgi:flagellar biosynthesis protein FliP